jgi:hypothetical protein
MNLLKIKIEKKNKNKLKNLNKRLIKELILHQLNKNGKRFIN